MKHFLIAAAIALPSSSFADAQSDATFIVEQTVTQAMFEGALAALRPVLLSAVENDLRNENVTVSDVGAFMDIMMEEFIAEYTVEMQNATIPYYVENFSAKELSDIAAFYASDTGVVLINRTPELMQFGATAGAQAGELAFRDSRDRVRQRLIDENVDVTNGDASMMQRLLEALR